MRCGRCGKARHRAWCPVPGWCRRDKRLRWRNNKTARATELHKLVRAQAADMRRGHQQPAERLGPERRAVTHYQVLGEPSWYF